MTLKQLERLAANYVRRTDAEEAFYAEKWLEVIRNEKNKQAKEKKILTFLALLQV